MEKEDGHILKKIMKTIENGCTFNTVSILFSLNKEIKEKNKNECERRDKKKSCELTCI